MANRLLSLTLLAFAGVTSAHALDLGMDPYNAVSISGSTTVSDRSLETGVGIRSTPCHGLLGVVVVDQSAGFQRLMPKGDDAVNGVVYRLSGADLMPIFMGPVRCGVGPYAAVDVGYGVAGRHAWTTGWDAGLDLETAIASKVVAGLAGGVGNRYIAESQVNDRGAGFVGTFRITCDL